MLIMVDTQNLTLGLGTNTTVTVNITVIATPSHGTSIQLSTLPCPVSANLSTMASPSQPSIPFPTAANITGGIIGNMTAITRPLAPMNPGGNLFDSRPGITFHFRPSTVRPSTASHKAFNGIALAVLIAMVGAATLML